MDIEKIAKLINLMQESSLTSLEVEEDDFRIRLGREKEIIAAPAHYASAPALPAPATGGGSSSAAAAAKEEKGVKIIKSPMVGTFYRAPSPESPAFVEEGAKVRPDTIVCIIEAMKVMNEIVAECSGTVLEILVENGEPIEFGQPIMKVKEG